MLRFAISMRTGTASASLMLERLGAYPRQNGLALGLREIGRIERTLFMLDWIEIRAPAAGKRRAQQGRGTERSRPRGLLSSPWSACAIVPPRRNKIVRAGSRSSPPLSRCGTLSTSVERSMNCGAAAKSSPTCCWLTSLRSAGSTSISPAIICGMPMPTPACRCGCCAAGGTARRHRPRRARPPQHIRE